MTFERKHIIATRVTREYSEVSSGFGPHDQGKGVRRQAGHGVWLANKTKKTRPHPLALDSLSLLTMPLVAKRHTCVCFTKRY